MMLTWNRWICRGLLALIFVAPALAGTNDADGAKVTANAAINGGTQPVSGASEPVPLNGGSANLTALLGVLVMKGVLAPAEANAIRNAAPEAEF